LIMSVWDEYHRRIELWERAGDSERLEMPRMCEEAFLFRETDPEHMYALFTRCRDAAKRLDEPWWVLFFESWRLSTLTSDLEDFERALPLAMELMVPFNSPAGQSHPMRMSVLNDVLCTYVSRDPVGFEEELRRGFAYLDGQITQAPSSDRLILLHRRGEYLCATEQWAQAYDLAHDRLAKIDRSGDSDDQIWHEVWSVWQLCHICNALGKLDELAAHAETVSELSDKNPHLRRTKADASIWKALLFRRAGNQRNASQSFHAGLRLLKGLEARDTICADPMAKYYEAGEDWREALGVRDRELAAVAKKGMLHRACQVQLERCRLLAQMGQLTPADLVAVRQSAEKLRTPKWCLDRLRSFEPLGGTNR
jgi:hypothetical protein